MDLGCLLESGQVFDLFARMGDINLVNGHINHVIFFYFILGTITSCHFA